MSEKKIVMKGMNGMNWGFETGRLAGLNEAATIAIDNLEIRDKILARYKERQKAFEAKLKEIK